MPCVKDTSGQTRHLDERHHERRRSPPTSCAPGAAHVLRLRRLWVVDGEHLPRQQRRLCPDQAAAASGGRHDQSHAGQHNGGANGRDAISVGATGLTGMQHADGEILAARAARKAGVPFTLSTMSICSIEDVAADLQSPFWFQLYVMKDQDFINRLSIGQRPPVARRSC